MKTSCMRLLTALVLVAAATVYQGNVQAANAAATTEEYNCFSDAVLCMAIGGFPSEPYQLCEQGQLWQAFQCDYFWGGGYGHYCAYLGTCPTGDEAPCDEDPSDGCDV